MTDVHTPQQRSFNMSRIRGRDTKPERIVRSLVHQMGYRFRLHRKDLPGKPDLVLPKEEWGDGSTHAWRIPAMKEKWAWAQRAWTRATNDTGSGDPQHATAEKGAQHLASLAKQIGTFLTHLASTSVEDLYE